MPRRVIPTHLTRAPEQHRRRRHSQPEKAFDKEKQEADQSQSPPPAPRGAIRASFGRGVGCGNRHEAAPDGSVGRDER